MKITVVGDVLLDVDIDGETTRLCPDAPVPVVDVAAVRRRAGGAGLVASMLADDGHDVSLVTVLSDDEAGRTLDSCLGAVALVAGPSGLPTPVKTRVRAAGRPVVRYDEGCGEVRVPEVTGAMLDAIRDAAVIVVSDYGRGLTSNPELRAALEPAAGRVPVDLGPAPEGRRAGSRGRRRDAEPGRGPGLPGRSGGAGRLRRVRRRKPGGPRPAPSPAVGVQSGPGDPRRNRGGARCGREAGSPRRRPPRGRLRSLRRR